MARAGAADFEVVVAGGGPAGAAAASWLARAGRRVLVIDPVAGDGAAGTADKIGESLPGAARPLLRDLGLSSCLDESGAEPHPGNLSDWDGRGLVATDGMRDPHGRGWHLDRVPFDRCLRAAAEAAGAVWQRGRLHRIERRDEAWRLVATAGQAKARWLIDATGRAGAVVRRLGIARRREAPRVAVYAFAATAGPPGDARTLVERVADGWWYGAPLPRGRRVASFHTSPAVARRLLRDEGSFAVRLAATRHLRGYCPPASVWGEPRAADAGGSRLETFCGDGWLAAGDAATAFDPISSQGLFHALYTGLRGAQAVDAALLGDPLKLAAYAGVLENVWTTYTGRIRSLYRQPFLPA